MSITSRPVSEARRNRGTGNNMNLDGDKSAKWLDHGFRGKTGTYVTVEGVGLVEFGEAISKYGYDKSKLNGNYNDKKVIVKNYEHYNRSLPNWDTPYGKYIGSKSQYDNECAKAGMISQEKADELADKKAAELKSDYTVSDDTIDLINSTTKNSDGTVHVSDRAIDRLIEKRKGSIREHSDVSGLDSQSGGFSC